MAARIASAALALLATTTRAQYSGWMEDQANATMCTWKLPRVGIVRDTLYMDGGDLNWSAGMQTGEYSEPTLDRNPRGVMLSLNLSKSFSFSDSDPDNITALMDTHPRVSGASNDIMALHVDGALLANDARFFLYGGMTRKGGYVPDADYVQEYQAHALNDDDSFEPGFVSGELPDGITRNVAYGVGVSAPSEGKAWYFSGARAKDHGALYSWGTFGTEDGLASEMAESFVTLEFDRDSPNAETWRNDTLPDSVGKRGGASGVFVPVGEEGILVFMGGVTHGDFSSENITSENPAALKEESEAFMTTIDIYDVASGNWYQQKSSSSTHPPILAMGCAVVQAAPDRTSFNIYHYGGYGGADPREDFTDDVWILTLPSFKWIKGLSGDDLHARAGHRCVTPYPDQMMVVGGFVPAVGSGMDCLDGGVIQVLNLTSLEWLEGYDPEVYGEYGVPEVVFSEIGGDARGGATATGPDGGWDDDNLGDVFAEAYPTDRITTWYPYGSAQSTERPEVDPDDDDGGGLPGWVAPTLGVVLGLIVVVVCGVAFVFWRRRKALRQASMARRSNRDGK